jgi:DNA gyrase subunit B
VTILDNQEDNPFESLEAVRRHPAMYIGSTGPHGLHHLVREIVDNSVEEFLAGHCSVISVIVNADGSVTVTDNGRGIPTDVVEDVGKPLLDVVFTDMNLGYKLSKGSYRISGGLHGVGTPVVNALSEWLKVEVRRGGKVYGQTYHQGKPEGEPAVIGATGECGTTVTFMPDKEIFRGVGENNEPEHFAVEWKVLETYLREMAYLSKGLTITLEDRRGGEGSTKSGRFHFEDGIASYVEYLNLARTPLHKPPIYLKERRGSIVVECALQWTDFNGEYVYAFVNNANTSEGGTHFFGFRSALTRVVNDYAKQIGLITDGASNIDWQQLRRGITAVVSVRVPEPEFEGSLKECLTNKEVQDITDQVVYETLSKWFAANPEPAQAIISRMITVRPT